MRESLPGARMASKLFVRCSLFPGYVTHLHLDRIAGCWCGSHFQPRVADRAAHLPQSLDLFPRPRQPHQHGIPAILPDDRRRSILSGIYAIHHRGPIRKLIVTMGANLAAEDLDRLENKLYLIKPAERLVLTEDCKHYEDKHDVPQYIQKYFAQRYSLFKLYDMGIYLTDEAWFGVTPEYIASEIACELGATNGKKKILIDAFSGVGGNTIAFALSKRWDRIIAIEQDRSTLACAQHNAELHGVDASAITWVLGDSFQYVDWLKHHPSLLHPWLRVDLTAAVLFASPPWGGPDYQSAEIFDLHTMWPYNLEKLHFTYKFMDHALFLPRTSDVRQIAELAPPGRKIQLVQYCLMGASKGIVAYIPTARP